jgi:hypothetical protein
MADLSDSAEYEKEGWCGDGLWYDSGGHKVIIRIDLVNAVATKQPAIVIENSNSDWSGHGSIRGEMIDVYFHNGVHLSANLACNDTVLEWSNGVSWSRQTNLVQPDTGHAQIEEPVQAGPRQMDLHHEVVLLHSFVDMFLLASLLVGVIAMYCSVLPVITIPFLCSFTTLPCIVIGASVVYSAKAFDAKGILLLLVNVLIIAPYNAACFLAFYLTWPLRMVVYQVLQYVTIPLMTFGTVHTPFFQSTFVGWLTILPIAYNNILPKDPKFKPFDNIDDATQKQAAEALQNAAFLKFLKKWSGEHIPVGVLNAFAFRLIFFMVMIPTMGWWLVGQCFIPFLPIRAQDSQTVGKREEEMEVEGKTESDIPKGLPPVTFVMPQCRLLHDARKQWSESVARQKCLNE